MALGMVRLLGWLVIAHGFSHAVLPLRGSIGSAMLMDDWTPVGLYAVGMVGFVAAGLGLLGLRPLDRAISPLLVLASGLSLVAIVRFANSSLWFGAACDIALLLLGLWRAYGGWPSHPAHGRIWYAAGPDRRPYAADLPCSRDVHVFVASHVGQHTRRTGPQHFTMRRRMMLTIKSLAEQRRAMRSALK